MSSSEIAFNFKIYAFFKEFSYVFKCNSALVIFSDIAYGMLGNISLVTMNFKEFLGVQRTFYKYKHKICNYKT